MSTALLNTALRYSYRLYTHPWMVPRDSNLAVCWSWPCTHTNKAMFSSKVGLQHLHLLLCVFRPTKRPSMAQKKIKKSGMTHMATTSKTWSKSVYLMPNSSDTLRMTRFEESNINIVLFCFEINLVLMTPGLHSKCNVGIVSDCLLSIGQGLDHDDLARPPVT